MKDQSGPAGQRRRLFEAVAFVGAAPILLLLLARGRRWPDLGLALVALLIALAALWDVDAKPGLLAGYLTVQAAFCALGLAFLLLRWLNRRITTRIAGSAPFKLTLWSGLVLAALALCVNFIHPVLLGWLFARTTVVDTMPLLLSQASLMQGTAIVLIFTLLNVLQSWFRRRIASGKRPVPALANIIVSPGVMLAVGGVLYMVLNRAAPNLPPGAHPGMPIGCSVDGCAEA